MFGVVTDLLLIETVTRNDIHAARHMIKYLGPQGIATMNNELKLTLAARIRARRVLFQNYTEGVKH